MLKLHLDTDIGGDIDDLCALAMLLNWPGVELLAVTTNSEDGGRRAGYARYVLALAGCTGVTVAAGADIALGHYRVTPGVPDETRYWPEPVALAPGPLENALDALERSIEQGAIIAAIGAYTNLALLEERSPGILQHAKLFLMGGQIFPPRAGFPAYEHNDDWNIQVDAQSAHTVLERANPTLVPLGVTVETALRRAHLATLQQSGPLAQLVARQALAYAEDEKYETKYGRIYSGVPDDIINFQHDPLTCAIALGWNEGMEIREFPLQWQIEDSWLRHKIDPSGKPTRVVTGVNGDAFNAFWLNTSTVRADDHVSTRKEYDR